MLLLITFSYSRLVSCFISFYLRCELNRSEMKHNEQKKANSNDAENERETEIERDREQKHITRMYAKKYERIGNFFLFIYSVLFFCLETNENLSSISFVSFCLRVHLFVYVLERLPLFRISTVVYLCGIFCILYFNLSCDCNCVYVCVRLRECVCARKGVSVSFCLVVSKLSIR